LINLINRVDDGALKPDHATATDESPSAMHLNVYAYVVSRRGAMKEPLGRIEGLAVSTTPQLKANDAMFK
jgi:hypothetical protein